jgi:hypothetical protein
MKEEERQRCRYCGGAGKFQVMSSVSDGAWASCFCSRATTEQAGPVMPEWQPIETAPKDVWARSTHILCAHDEKRWVRFGRYYGELKRWYYSGTNERTQWSEAPGDAPTHWAPFPTAPGTSA